MSEDESLVAAQQQRAREAVESLTASWEANGVDRMASLFTEHAATDVQAALTARAAFLRDERPPVWCVGLPRTGTVSICAALGILGWRPVHCPRGWDGLEGFNAAGDIWIAARWRDLLQVTPGARFVLTTRDFDSWVRSHRSGAIEGFWRSARWWDRVHRRTVYGTDDRNDAETLRQAWDRHHAEIRATIPACQLLELPQPFAWDPLCAFLGVDAPRVQFPHHNAFVERDEP